MGAESSTDLPMSAIDFETYQGLRYTQEVPNSREPSRGPIYVTKPLYVDESKLTLYTNFLTGVAIDNGTRNLYGTRKIVNGQAREYEWITYNQALAYVEAIASGLTKFARLKRGDMVGIFSKNRAEWCLSSHACDRMTYTLVPLYDTLGADAVPYIVNHTELTTIIYASELFNVVLECVDACPTLKYIVQYEDVTEAQRRMAAEKGLELKSLAELEALGKSHPLPADPPTPEDIATICYTSGTTGNPKGVVLKHRNMAIIGSMLQELGKFHSDTVHMSYLPLPHVFERAIMSLIVYLGAAAGFYQGDVLTLMDDMVALQPTLFISVPRLYNRVYDKITQGVAVAGGLKKMMFDQAYAAKKAARAEGYKLMRFGTLWCSRSAEVKEFMAVAFGCDFLEGYGLSETGAVVSAPLRHTPLGAHVGMPLPNLLVRLEDVPEMGYTSNDKPRPRGEIICKGPNVFSGYYKEPEKTAEAIDQDGWFHTGDIGCWNADGTLSIIDRKKNIFKLSQGEYIAAEKIENIYAKSKYVAQIFVYGDSYQSMLVAVAVPDPEVAEAWGTSKGLSREDSTAAKLVNDSEFQREVLNDMTRVGKDAQLRGFEFVKKVHFHPDAFSVDAGLITPTFKLKRPQLKTYFQKEIDAMYAAVNK
ncbi:hypothetical protein Poli38472_014877 [Pythium oligandrum]|uniref:AMP-dependent synthetase/ligase domain-containing protein n=1 Tax=Pythium oligandrum TaxID=41045 RepID=A0A8K1CPY9_PYTOL|nr:hypothetical protein Poli38472_014877 [Pythium oligandrum]|eukprot:TMW66575.1 hypothetical protein Poli38472_014877 [Pythium oligandrum]